MVVSFEILQTIKKRRPLALESQAGMASTREGQQIRETAMKEQNKAKAGMHR